MMLDHILIIGGTGMLRSASILLAGRCKLLTSVASTTDSLEALDKEVRPIGTQHNLVPLNWESPAFLQELTEHLQNRSAPSLVVAWLHKYELGPKVAQALSELYKEKISFYQVLGASAGSPKNVTISQVSLPSNIQLRIVILGFEIENGKSRWLTNPEISEGVITAINSNSETSIVGRVSPWSECPA